MHNQPREPQPYEDCQENQFNNLGSSRGMDWGWGQVIKSTTHRRVEEFGYSCLQRRLTWAKRRRTELLPSGPKSSFQMRASFVFHLETKVLESGGRVEKFRAQAAWSPVLSLHSLWWFGAMSSAGVGPSTSLHPFTKRFWSTSCFLLLTSFLKMLISFSSRIWHLSTLTKHQKLVKWPNDWPANSPDLNIENLWGIVKRKMRNKRPNNADELKATVKETWASHHLSSATHWSPPCHLSSATNWSPPCHLSSATNWSPPCHLSSATNWSPPCHLSSATNWSPPRHLSSATNWSPPCHAELRQ